MQLSFAFYDLSNYLKLKMAVEIGIFRPIREALYSDVLNNRGGVATKFLENLDRGPFICYPLPYFYIAIRLRSVYVLVHNDSGLI